MSYRGDHFGETRSTARAMWLTIHQNVAEPSETEEPVVHHDHDDDGLSASPLWQSIRPDNASAEVPDGRTTPPWQVPPGAPHGYGPYPQGPPVLLPDRSRPPVSASDAARHSPAIVATVSVAVAAVVIGLIVVAVPWHRTANGVAIAAPTGTTTTNSRPTDTTTTQSTVASPTSGSAQAGYLPATGPAGVQVNIPATWQVVQGKYATVDEADDPDDPNTFVRYGGSPSPAMSLMDSVTQLETSVVADGTGYQRLQIAESTTSSGDDLVVWDFTFTRNGVSERAEDYFWRYNGTDYAVYLATSAGNWDAVQPILTELEQTAGPR